MQPDTLLHVPVLAREIPGVAVPAIRVFMPMRVLQVTSTFGWRRHPVTGKADYHAGVDLSARSEPVYSILDGRVSAIGYSPILGNYIRIAHGEIQSIYGHLSFILVTAGQSVSGGYPVGITGATGRATGEHLHFSISAGGTHIHPLYFLNSLLTGIEHKL